MFYINKEIEKLNEKIFSNNEEIKKKNRDISDKNKILNDKDKIKLLKEETQIKLFQVIPQRTSIKASYITIDTSALINLVVKENISEYFNNVEQYTTEHEAGWPYGDHTIRNKVEPLEKDWNKVLGKEFSEQVNQSFKWINEL